MMSMGRRLTGGLLAVVAVGAVAACGSDESQASRTPQELALTADEFPDGYALQAVSKEQVVDLAKQAAASVEPKVSPASCAQPAAVPEDVTADKLGMAIAMKAEVGTITDVVSRSERDVESFRAAVTGECATVTKNIRTGLRAKVVSTVVDAPAALDGRDVFVFEQLTTAKSGSKVVKTRRLNGVAKVDGYLVRVEYAPAKADADLDRSDFDAAFTRAVEKIANG